MLGLLPWAIEALKLAAFAAVKPLFMTLVSSLLSPKLLLKCFLQLAEMLVKHTDTQFDDKLLEDLKASMQVDLDKYLAREESSKSSS